MKTKHTPAPWFTQERFFNVYATSGANGTGLTTCIAKINSDQPQKDEVIANMRLVAAAPDLLEALIACNEVMNYISEWHIPINLPHKIKSAIAKATGVTND